MEKNFNKMPEHEWSEFVYEKQVVMMKGLGAQVDIIDGYIQRFGDQNTADLLDQRGQIHYRLRDLHYSNLRLMDQLKPQRPLLAMDYSWTDEHGKENRLVIKPGWRERTFNMLTRLLRKWLLNGQIQLTD